jgi:hypothetical protein
MAHVNTEVLAAFQGWQRYPLNLGTRFPDFNLEFCHRLLQREAGKLFSPDITDVRVGTIPCSDLSRNTGEISDHVTSESQLEEVLSVSLNDLMFVYLGADWTVETSWFVRRSLHVRDYLSMST